MPTSLVYVTQLRVDVCKLAFIGKRNLKIVGDFFHPKSDIVLYLVERRSRYEYVALNQISSVDYQKSHHDQT